MEIAGNNALVTGAAGGLGRYICRALAAQGANVVVSDLDGGALDARAKEVAGFGTRVEAVAADLAKQGERRGLIEQAERALGPIDLLVNNAGVEFVGPYAEAPLSQIDLITKVNLLTPMELTRIALPGMLERRRGHVVNIASLAGKASLAYFHTYNATKFGVVGFTHAIRHELSGEPVSTSVICPGFIAREGMYGRVEDYVEQHGGNPLGASPPERVGAAVVRAIREDQAEIIISRRPIRPLIALASVAPKAAIWLNEKAGTREAAREFGAAEGRF
ncbi:MAG TPA: SDR family NAD(P)-dependent oxidoreductase [Solirubrobacterales bacterium]